MKKYYKSVDLRSRKQMVDFLKSHFRYHTMNSWNRSTSYANNVKVYNLGLSSEEQDKLYELLDLTEFYDRINIMLYEFGKEHGFWWQAGFNGRSSGYIVLYKGFLKRSDYKSYCTECGHRNYKTVEESNSCKCGYCGMEARVNYSIPPLEYGTYPGKNVDMGEDFEDWDMYSLKERTKLVQEFDKLCDDILLKVKDIIANYEIDEETVYIPKTVKKLKEVS